jgi:hypothetical protein
MIWAHRSVASDLPEGHWLIRLRLDPANDLGHPTLLPRVADCSACTDLRRSGGGGNPQRGLLKSKLASAAAIAGSNVSEGERCGIAKQRRRARGTEATISSKNSGSK